MLVVSILVAAMQQLIRAKIYLAYPLFMSKNRILHPKNSNQRSAFCSFLHFLFCNVLTKKENYALFLLAVLATFWGYSFGASDHLEHLPILYRILDPDYLLQDDFVNANTQGYNPRVLFFYVLSPFARILGVELLYLLGALACNFFIARASVLIVRKLWEKERGALWTAALVLALPLSGWGEVAYLRANIFIPSTVATAVVLHGLYYMLSSAWWRMSIVLGLGAIAHPLVCPVSAAMLWFLGFVALFQQHKWAWRQYLAFAGAALLWAVLVAAIILPYLLQNWWAAKIDGQLFVEIYAHFRNPHHFLPEFFMNEQETRLAWQWAGVLTGLFCFHALGLKSYQVRKYGLLFGLLAIVLLLLPFGAWGVSEYKSRFWAMLQVFRFLFIAKWLILALLGLFFAQIIAPIQSIILRTAYILLFPLLCLVPNLLFWAVFAHVLARLTQQRNLVAIAYLSSFGLAIAAIFYLPADADIFLPMGLFFIAFLCTLEGEKTAKIGLILATICIALFQVHWWGNVRQKSDTLLAQNCSRQYKLSEIESDFDGVAAYLRQNTPANTLLLTPPSSSLLRLTARRALVVDFKTLPFDDLALVAWRDRLFDCYGQSDKLGFEAQRWIFTPNYQYAPIADHVRTADRYSATHILLYAQSPHDTFKLLYQDKYYKLVVGSRFGGSK
jgi:hypothetical protein